MLMSWNPGDLSAIHDHGQTQWGAVMDSRTDGITADLETTLEHHQQMLDRIFRIQSSTDECDPRLDDTASQLIRILSRTESKVAA